jgi:hypothetical protein
VLDLLRIKAFDLVKMIQTFVKSLPTMPRCARGRARAQHSTAQRSAAQTVVHSQVRVLV